MDIRKQLAVYLGLLFVVVAAALFAVGTLEVPDDAVPGDELRDDSGAEDPAGPRYQDPGHPPTHDQLPGYRMYLVLDDAGNNLDEVRQFLSFSGTFTVAVLPGLRFTGEAARMVRAMGHEVILHQPMEAQGGEDPGPGAIFLGDTPMAIAATLADNLRAVGPVRGINNHMGSAVTADASAMAVILGYLSQQGLYFLDSRTTAESVVEAVAEELGIPVLVRHVFLDHHRHREAIAAQFDRAEQIARDTGEVIMIGHVMVEDLAVELLAREERLAEEGFVFLPLSDALERRGMNAGSRD